MAHRYSVVIWHSPHGFHAVIPALGMSPVIGESRREALRICRESAMSHFALNQANKLPMPPDVKVTTDHLDIRDDGQVRNFASQFITPLNVAMTQLMLQLTNDPEAVQLVVKLFSELTTTLRDMSYGSVGLMLGNPMAEPLWTSKELTDFADEVLEEFCATSNLTPAQAKQLRDLVRETLTSEFAQVGPIDPNYLADLTGPLGLLGGLLGPYDDDEDLDEPDAFDPYVTALPPALGPMQHPPRRKERKRS